MAKCHRQDSYIDTDTDTSTDIDMDRGTVTDVGILRDRDTDIDIVIVIVIVIVILSAIYMDIACPMLNVTHTSERPPQTLYWFELSQLHFHRRRKAPYVNLALM